MKQSQGRPWSAIGEGVCVLDTVWASPADEAGITHGDYILSVNGDSVSTPKQLVSSLKKVKGGDKVDVTLWRRGNTIQREVTLATRAERPPASHQAWLGVMSVIFGRSLKASKRWGRARKFN
ncbi:PDZ domain-containing protein [Neorhodopirellula pilleata]|uniref:PDZ domain-containing protein n=1 Tax=Neorhodopirellula pilleata TaxID=2714738 RepID=UPI0018CCAA51|nr:PDZ domain-containing protein [Neorhodopirellula pilleata]